LKNESKFFAYKLIIFIGLFEMVKQLIIGAHEVAFKMLNLSRSIFKKFLLLKKI